MPEPWPHPKNGTFYCRIIVPADLAAKAKGERISLPVAGKLHPITISTHVKVSLGTKDRAEAKRRFVQTHAAVEDFWRVLRTGPITLNLKQRLGLAGEIREAITAQHEDEPGKPEQWREFAQVVDVALDQDSDREGRNKLLDMLVGDFIDEALAKRGWRITDESREELLEDIAVAVRDAFQDVEAMARRDYSMRRYPRLDAPEAAPAQPPHPITFKSIIDDEYKRRTRGKGAQGVSEKTFTKFRRETQSFVDHRESDDALTVTDDEIAAWVIHLQGEGNLSNRTIGNALTNVRTVWKWGQKQHRKKFPVDDPFSHVERPGYDEKPSDQRTFTLTEAKAILTTAKLETTPELRWLPWLCSFSGARISELNALTKEDFFAVNGVNFFKLTKSGGRTLKTRSSERRIPVHPTLVKDGFLEFVAQHGGGKLFVARAHENVGKWVRETVGITREGVGPNHGWRHLFDDLMTVAGIPSDAAHYLAGRATASSRNIYGKSEAMLPGLAQEMAKIPSMLEWNPGEAEQQAEGAET